MENQKQLRFAPIIRVSTEKTERRGESLKIQKRIILNAVDYHNGIIPEYCWQYTGQEHATPNQERKLLNKVLSDAGKDLFDAVIAADYSRWSRDNRRSKEGLEILRNFEIRFFLAAMEYNLFNPEHLYMLGIGVEGAEYHSHYMQKRSLEVRINMAYEGIPASKPLPSGRIFKFYDGKYKKRGGKWYIDKSFKRKIEGAANSFLDGESLGGIAKRLNMSRSTLRTIFKEKAGDIWYQNFNVPKFNIHEQVPTKVPRLLQQNVINDLRAKFEANKTIFHGSITNEYLLSRMIICADCGCAFVGSTDKKGRKYYRHRSKDCIGQKSFLAERLDNAVLLNVFDTFGDIEKIKLAVEDALPNKKELNKLRSRKKDLDKDLKSEKLKKKNMIRAIAEGTIEKSDKDVKEEFRKIKERIELLEFEIQKINSKLDEMPSKEDIEEKAAIAIGLKKRWFKTLYHLNDMSYEERKKLLQRIFFNRKNDGERLGIYMKKRGSTWTYTINGVLINRTGYMPMINEQIEYSRAILGYCEDDDNRTLKEFLNGYNLKSKGIFPGPVKSVWRTTAFFF